MTATAIPEIRDSFKREINAPGFEQFPDISGSEIDGYIVDGFWEARLAGVFKTYTIIDDSGTDYVVALGETDSSGDPFPEYYRIYVVITAGARILRMKALNLATQFKAEAGPMSYEQEVSATVLREILRSLERRLNELKQLYSDELGAGTLYALDGVLQREADIIGGLADLSVI